MEAAIIFLGLFAFSEADFFEKKNEHAANGYNYWEKLDPCRAPSEDPNVESLVMTTPIGNKYVCFKQTKRQD
jgi:hypothetical protein